MLGWLGLLLLLGGCESRPAAGLPVVPGSRVPKPAAAALMPAGTDVLGPLPRAIQTPPRPLPPDTNLLGARLAVLRQATLPADTSAPLITKASPLPRHVVQLLPGQTGTRRYVGTLGGQRVVAELTGIQGTRQEPGHFVGSYYFEWGGQAHSLRPPAGFRSDRPLFLIEQNDDYEEDTTGTWRAVQRLGPLLTGTWTDKRTRRTARFTLHESYAGAVRYEVLYERIESRDSCRGGSSYYRHSFVEWESLHLLGADTLRPALRHLQCLPPRRRRQAMRQQLTSPVCEEGMGPDGKLHHILINYNGNGLLCFTLLPGEDVGAAYPSDYPEERLVDLATGRECTPDDWLRPDKQLEIRQLFTRHLLADETGVHNVPSPYIAGLEKEPYLLAQLPPLLLTSQGLAFRLGEVGAPHVTRLVPITIPFAALAPYVLPSTPLARLVAARTRPRR